MLQIHTRVFKVSIIIILLLTGGLLSYSLWQGSHADPLYGGTSDNSLEDYYNLIGQRGNLDQHETELTFHAVGDIMLAREVANRIARNQRDAYWPFRALEQELGWEADFNFGNLESPFSGNNNAILKHNLQFNAPTWAFAGLEQYNFKVLNLANNHAMDQDLVGLLNTRDLIREHDMIPIGVGATLDEAWRGSVFSMKGIRVGFVGASYTSMNDGGYARNNYIARIEDTDRLINSINDLKTRSDFIVVSMHAGVEYERLPHQSQIDFSRAAIDAGADLVIGAHPHWVQTIEKYQGKYIFYSLGNFVFDQMWSQDTREGLMLKITLTKPGLCHPGLHPNSPTPLSRSDQINLVCTTDLQGSRQPAKLKTIELIPIVIEDYGQPRKANEQEKQNILNKIDQTETLLAP